MKFRRLGILALAMLMIVSLFSGCGGSSAPAASGTSAAEGTQAPSDGNVPAESSGETYSWNLGSVGNDPVSVPDFNGNSHAIQKFADTVSELTDGRANITIHWASVLGNNVTMFEEVQMGTLDFHAGQAMSSADKRFGCWNLPFVFSNYDEVYAATNRKNGPVFALSEQWMAEDGVKLLALGVGSMRGFVSRVEVHTPADVSKLKIRTYEDALVNTYWGSIGTASIIPGSEIYSALQTKTVDAMEFHASGVYAFRLNEVADYFLPLNWQCTMGTTLSMPLELWESLPADIQDAIDKAADAYEETQYTMIKDEDAKAREMLASLGMNVTELTDSDLAAWKETAVALTDYFKDYVGADVYDAYMAAVEQAKTAG